MARRRRTAKQIAASKRNIVAAQRRSAQLRRNGAIPPVGRKKKKFYSKPRARTRPRTRAKPNGITAVERAKTVVALANVAVSGAAVGIAAHNLYKKNPDVEKSIKTAARRAKVVARKAKLR